MSFFWKSLKGTFILVWCKTPKIDAEQDLEQWVVCLPPIPVHMLSMVE
jgi:hypothetical protein